MAYVGTFSSPLRDVLPTQVDLPPGNGRGIHLFRVDRTTGALTPAGVHEMGTSPSCLALNAAGTRLYSANETDRVGRRQAGHGQRLRHRSGRRATEAAEHRPLRRRRPDVRERPPVGAVRAGGQLLRRLGGGAADPRRRPPGRRHGHQDGCRQARPRPGEERPAGQLRLQRARSDARAHDPGRPAGRFVLHVDLGLDRIFVWKFDDEEGPLTPNEPPAVSLPPGDGPRHFHFHPNGRWLYSIQEEGSTIVLFDYDATGRDLTPRQTISTLPPGFAGSNFCSEILVSADGRFVYAGNRLHDSIGIFSVGPNGDLTYVGEEWTRGNYPAQLQLRPHRAGSSTAATSEATTSPSSGWIARPAASSSPAITPPSAILRSSSSSISARWDSGSC